MPSPKAKKVRMENRRLFRLWFNAILVDQRLTKMSAKKEGVFTHHNIPVAVKTQRAIRWTSQAEALFQMEVETLTPAKELILIAHPQGRETSHSSPSLQRPNQMRWTNHFWSEARELLTYKDV